MAPKHTLRHCIISYCSLSLSLSLSHLSSATRDLCSLPEYLMHTLAAKLFCSPSGFDSQTKTTAATRSALELIPPTNSTPSAARPVEVLSGKESLERQMTELFFLYCRGAVYIQVYTWFPNGCDPWVVTANGWA
jgi:hypothetical protein